LILKIEFKVPFITKTNVADRRKYIQVKFNH